MTKLGLVAALIAALLTVVAPVVSTSGSAATVADWPKCC